MVVVPVVEAQVVRPVVVAREAVEQAAQAAERAVVGERPEVVVLPAVAAVLPAAGILDLIAILISTILTTNRG